MKNFKFKWLLLSIILSIASISHVWGHTSRALTNPNSVHLVGSMNDWGNTDWDNIKDQWALSKVGGDGNHWIGYFLIKGSSSNYEFKLRVNDNTFSGDYSTAYGYHSGYTGGWVTQNDFTSDRGNASLTPLTSSTDTYIGVTVEFYARYGNNNDGGYLRVEQKQYGTSLFTNGQALYLDADGMTSGARFAAVFLRGDGGYKNWQNMTQIGSSTIYTVDVPEANVPCVIFCRMNASDATNDFDDSHRYNQSADLTPVSYNLYDFTGYGSGKLFNGNWAYNMYRFKYDKGANGTGTEYTDYQQSGESIDLRGAIFTREGYTQTAWNTNSSGTGGTSYTLSASHTASADLTLYPTWTLITNSVTIATNDATMGTLKINDASQSFGSAYTIGVTSKITVTPNAGYYFTGWSEMPSGMHKVTDETTKYGGDAYFYADGTGKTITANFAKRFVLRGSRSTGSDTEGMPGFETTDADMTISAGISSKTVTLLPNREYKFMIYDLVHSRQCGYTTSNQTLAANTWTGSMNGTYHLLMNTAGYGNYTFEVRVSSADGSGNTWPEVRITNPDSWQISMGLQTKTDGDGTVGTGGSVSAKDGDNYTIVNGNYVKSGGSVTFTATPNDGYQFIGWYSSSTTNGEDQDVEAISTENPYTVSGITENKTVYALFKEILFDVNVDDGSGTPDLIQVGIVSHPSITAVKRSGLLFNRWETTGSAVLSDRYANPATINSVSDNQSTVTATYKDLPYIYYDITGPHSKAVSPWQPSTMYVYFYTSAYWDGTYGAGYKNRDKHYGQMEEVDGSNGTLWRYRYDPDTIGTITNVAFIADNQPNYEHFESTGSYCAYHSCNNMFVVTKDAGLSKNAGHSWYYNDDATGKYGYWSNYGETTEARTGLASGFYLNYLTGSGYSEEFIDEDGDGTFELTANLSGSTTYGFYIGGCGGGNWSNKDLTLTATFKSGAFYIYENLNSQFAHITTNVPGYYTFKLTPQKGNGEEPSLTLSVEYPVADGDYRATITRGGKKYTSNTIKSGVSSGTISLWLAQGDNTIAFEVASETAGVISWGSDGSSNQTVNVAKAGVYTMTLVENGTTPRISDVQAYTGKYYIRTDWAPGGWQDYKDNPLIQNTLTYKEGDATTFDYYYCKWISKSGSDANVRFVVANDYNMAISDTLKTDAALNSQEYLPADHPANVRFSWNSSTNTVNRAYIAGSTKISDRFLVMKGDEKLFNSSGRALTTAGGGKVSGLNDYELNFADNNNWVYQVDIQAISGAEVYLIARYNGVDRDLYGSSSSKKTLITSTDDKKKYNLTTIYDFKTNNLMTAWKPGVDPIIEEISDVRSVMLVREHQNGADQITIGSGGSISETLVYGVMQFNKYTLNNQNSTGSHETLDPGLSPYERDLFWISFPFDVNLRDVFGFGEYGKHWIIEYYDGQGRADNGFWADSPSNWKFVTPEMRNDFELKNGVGYILALDLDELGMGSSVWNNSVTDVALYFPSSTAVTINADKATIDVPAHKCNIGSRFPGGEDRTIKDSHWNVIGVPSFANVAGLDSAETINGKSYPKGFGFYYGWDASDNSLDVTANSKSTTFNTMHAYMVQFTGTIDWSAQTATPSSVAARVTELPDRMYNLVLFREDEEQDHTLLRLTDDASVTNRFEFNYDLSKEYNAGRGNIWTVTADTVEVAGNSMPKPLQTTLVPVGVKVVANGEYTLAMPEGTNGEDVYLIDNAYGTRTNLGLMPYTVTLTAGTYEGRFALEFGPIQETATGVENDGLSRSDELNDANDDVRKVFVGGRLYIIRDGKVYDAAGQRVE